MSAFPHHAPSRWQGVIPRYAEFLPVSDSTPIISLCEGNTPLVPARNFAEAVGAKCQLYLKYEGLNPTASFKDRGMTVAISKACEKGAQAVVCASTGNTSASAAAYAARAKLKCVVILPHGNIAMGKLSQALIYGAQTIAVDGNFDVALRLVRELAAIAPVEIVNSINPVRIQGQKTAAFEICDQLGRAPDFHFLPVGNAGNITAYWQGFQEYFRHRRTKQNPKMYGFQAAGASPIVDGCPVEKPKTVASAIQIGNPAGWNGAVQAAQESGGLIAKVTDDEILHAYRKIAQTEGVFVEPACAAPLAGFIQSVRNGRIPEGSLITATMTGHGLKDPDCALAASGKEPELVPPNAAALIKTLGM